MTIYDNALTNWVFSNVINLISTLCINEISSDLADLKSSLTLKFNHVLIQMLNLVIINIKRSTIFVRYSYNFDNRYNR